ncbi:hypothetical protein GPECTOR_408g247 [Gonium pectorale]|uniref:Uncharacterized protein n=1 Tax=Gonium pectorale TaxID=33097 RepID=A0A150FVA8_GONPE|nr:hypothetical protein GPECTOR_408g247 [Gonium pectorale]|eukprot:KXZ41537.1 hypothetical protein GPECTOR_408g247 [Gonium pectorale]
MRNENVVAAVRDLATRDFDVLKPCIDKATPVFKDVMVDKKGQLVLEKGSDLWAADVGSSLRCQYVFNLPRMKGATAAGSSVEDEGGDDEGSNEAEDGTDAKVAKGLRESAEEVLMGVAAAMKMPCARPSAPALLVNKQKPRGPPVECQAPHLDLGRKQKGISAILALEAFSLLVYPGSEAVVKEFWRRLDHVSSGDHSPEDMDAWLASRKFRALRMKVEPGDIILLSGHTVHAGDRGEHGHMALRIHWYVTESLYEENETTPLKTLSSEFAEMFV